MTAHDPGWGFFSSFFFNMDSWKTAEAWRQNEDSHKDSHSSVPCFRRESKKVTVQLPSSWNAALKYQCCHNPLSLRQPATVDSWTSWSDAKTQRFCFSLSDNWGVCCYEATLVYSPPLDHCIIWKDFWEGTDLEAEPTWPSWLGNDSKLWSFFTASCGDKYKWLSSYCFQEEQCTNICGGKIIWSASRVFHSYCSLFCVTWNYFFFAKKSFSWMFSVWLWRSSYSKIHSWI